MRNQHIVGFSYTSFTIGTENTRDWRYDRNNGDGIVFYAVRLPDDYFFIEQFKCDRHEKR